MQSSEMLFALIYLPSIPLFCGGLELCITKSIAFFHLSQKSASASMHCVVL